MEKEFSINFFSDFLLEVTAARRFKTELNYIFVNDFGAKRNPKLVLRFSTY